MDNGKVKKEWEKNSCNTRTNNQLENCHKMYICDKLKSIYQVFRLESFLLLRLTNKYVNVNTISCLASNQIENVIYCIN